MKQVLSLSLPSELPKNMSADALPIWMLDSTVQGWSKSLGTGLPQTKTLEILGTPKNASKIRLTFRGDQNQELNQNKVIVKKN